MTTYGYIACRAFSFGVFFGGMTMLALVMAFTPNWQRQAIEHNAARYNATTGKFEWIERSDK